MADVEPLRAALRRLVPRPIRNWVRAPLQSAAWLLDALRYRLRGPVTVEVRSGWVVRSHPAAARLAYRSHLDDPAQVAELDAFIARCRPGMVLFDLGAHFGLVSLAALHYGGPRARAVAVDPSPTAQAILAIQARENGVDERLTRIRAGVAAEEGRMDLVATGVIAAGYFTAPRPQHPAGDRTVVRATTVDRLASVTGMFPTHVKVDVEGFELEALRGAQEVLRARRPPLLFLELHIDMLRRDGSDPGAVLDLLRAANFHTLSLDGTPITRGAILSEPLSRLIAVPHSDEGGW